MTSLTADWTGAVNGVTFGQGTNYRWRPTGFSGLALPGFRTTDMSRGPQVAGVASSFDTIDGIRKVKELYPDHQIVFANGGDRTANNIPEMVFDDVEFVFGVGGEDKKNSSSWILEDWKKPKTDRAWGYYRVLHEVGNHVKLKELTVNPKTCLSMQRHDKRAEFWFVAEGEATVYTVDPHSTEYDVMATPVKHQSMWIKCNEWHQLCNETDKPLKLIEIQYGENCVEEDIERK